MTICVVEDVLEREREKERYISVTRFGDFSKFWVKIFVTKVWATLWIVTFELF